MLIIWSVIIRCLRFSVRLTTFLMSGYFLFHVGIASSEDINSALSSAFSYHPSLSIARVRLEQAKANIGLAEAARGPNLTLSGNVGYYNSRSQSAIANTPLAKDNSENYGVAANIGYPIDILSGSRISENIKASQSRFLASKESFSDSKAALLLSTITAYSDLAHFEKIVRLRRNNLNALKEKLRATKAQIRGGEASSVELSQTEVRYYQAIIDLKNSQNDYFSRKFKFKEITGRNPIGKLEKIKKAPIKTKSLRETQVKMLQNNNTIKQLSLLQKASDYDFKVAEAEFLPKTNILAGYSYNKTPSTKFAAKSASNATISLQVQFDLYDSGLRKSHSQRAMSLAAENKYNLENGKNSMIASLETAWNNYKTSVNLLKSHKNTVNAAKRAEKALSRKKSLSEVTKLQVLDARNDVVNAEVAMAKEQSNVIIFSYQIAYLTGELAIDNVNK